MFTSNLIFAVIATILLNVACDQSPTPSPFSDRLGDCVNFAVHGGSKVAFNGGLTVVSKGDVGMSPGTSITGNYAVKDGSTEINSNLANHCAATRIEVYDAIRAKDCPEANKRNEVGGQTIGPGVYCDSGAPMSLSTGDLTLSGPGEYFFQASSSFLSSLNTKVILTNGAEAKDVFWSVGTSATLGTSSEFQGTMIAHASIVLQTKSTLKAGRALAGAAVDFESSNSVTLPTLV